MHWRGLILLLLFASPARAAEVHVAVASNFAATLKQLAAEFYTQHGHTLLISSGSTGKLYTQITQGAPYDVFLAADSARPQRLETEGRGLAGTRFTYARGRLVLWSRDPDKVDADGRVLSGDGFRHLAMANPRTAPFGLAAQQVLEKLGLWTTLQARLVSGEDIGQTYQFVATGNAELGFVALAQLQAGDIPGSRWLIPETLHAPIEQQAILLNQAREPTAARALLDYLRSASARRLIQAAGYAVP